MRFNGSFAAFAVVAGLFLFTTGCGSTTGKISGGGRLASVVCNPFTSTCDPGSVQLISFSTNISVKPDQKAKTGYVVSGHLTIQDPASNQKFFGKPIMAGAVCANFPACEIPFPSPIQQAKFNQLGSSSRVQNALKAQASKGGVYWSFGCYIYSNSITDLKQNDCSDIDGAYLSLMTDLDQNGAPGNGDVIVVAAADAPILDQLACLLVPAYCGAPVGSGSPEPNFLLGYLVNGNLSAKVNDTVIEDVAYSVSMSGVEVGRIRLQKQQTKGNGSSLSLTAAGLDLGMFQLPVNDFYSSVTDNQGCSTQFAKVSRHGSRVIDEETRFQSGTATRRNRLTGAESTRKTVSCNRDALSALDAVRQQLAAGVTPTAGTVYFGAAYDVSVSGVTSEQVTVGGITETADKVTFRSRGPASDWSFDVLFSRNVERTPIVLRAPLGFTATLMR